MAIVLIVVSALYFGALVQLVRLGSRPDASPIYFVSANYAFAILIGLSIGATELMGRYRDEPLAPLATIPGFFYVLINGGAAALAYFLIGAAELALSPWQHVLLAGVGAMAFFRSGFFNIRIGDSDVPVGPNLILQIVLQSLDRAYDRLRAVPRSRAVVGIMGGVAFSEVKEALPTLCFNLMQNVTDAEATAIRTQAEALDRSQGMSDESKIFSLGLALFNVVGEDTLKAAVAALGSRIMGFRAISDELRLESARVSAASIINALPQVCEALRPSASGPPDMPPDIEGLDEEAHAVLVLYRLVDCYGEPAVLAAVRILASVAAQPGGGGGVPAPAPATPPPSPPPVPAPLAAGGTDDPAPR